MREIGYEGSLDLRGTVAPLTSGFGDPTAVIDREGLIRATRTPDGPATLKITLRGDDRLSARAWGDGASWVLDRVGDLLGLDETPVFLDAAPEPVRSLALRGQGIRLSRTHRVVEALVLVVLQQKVTGKEAARAHRNLTRSFSEPAPGPFPDLWLPLGAEQLRHLAPAACTRLGVPARQRQTLERIGWAARRVEEASLMSASDAGRRLRAIPGVGAWSAGSVLLRALGDADAVPVGDYHLPSVVAFTLAGEERADDARMLELLAPYRGQRGRLIRWIQAGGRTPPRRGPRMPLRPLPEALPKG